MKILHIAPHYGGGTKTVILSWIKNDKQNLHTLVSLGYADEEVEKVCDDNDILLFYNYEDRNYSTILNLIPVYDIVLIHYWNFPLMLDFLTTTKLPECRLITWFHNSGFYSPSGLPKQIIEMSDKFIFTSPISYQLPIVKEFNKDKFGCIWSTGGIEKYLNIEKKEHEGFNILFVGTMDYSKLHEDFFIICQQILEEISDSIITVCGEGGALKNIPIELSNYIFLDRLKFKGLIKDLIPYYEQADLFLYPLQYKHFGTCEQSLGEAMASGTISIVFSNDCERYIIKHWTNGIIANDINDLVKKIKTIRENKELGVLLKQQAKIRAKELYNIDNMVNSWNILFNDIIKLDKKERDWNCCFYGFYGLGTTAFISAMSEKDSILFHEYISAIIRLNNLFSSNPQWQSESKGSIKQYLKYFPEDKWLQEFKKIMDKEI